MVGEGGDIAEALELGPITHVAIAVRSIEAARASAGRLGVSGWGDVFDLDVPALHRGRTLRMGLRAAFAAAPPIQYELVEPTNDTSPVATFLERQGEGVQHIGYQVEDLAAVLRLATSQGVAVDWLAKDEHGPAVAFLTPEDFCGVSLELIRTQPAIDFDPWRRPQDA